MVASFELSRLPFDDLGDGVDTNDVKFSDSFPYLALPASGSDPDPHPSKASNKPAVMKGVSATLQNENVAMSALGLGMLALLMGGAGFTRSARRSR